MKAYFMAILLSCILAVALFQVVTCVTYYVTPDDNYPTSNNTHLLEYYIDNSNEYFTSHSVFHFLPGHYHIQNDLIIQNITNISMIGNNSSISCNGSPNGIVIVNVKDFSLKNIALIQCGKNHSQILAKNIQIYDHIYRPSLHWISALFLHNCVNVTISDVLITVSSGTNGLLAANIAGNSTINDVIVHVECSQSVSPCSVSICTTTGGVMVYYYDVNMTTVKCFVYINNYTYRSDVHCSSTTSQYALVSLLVQSSYNAFVKVINTSFSDLHNTTAVYYYGESCGESIVSIFGFYNCRFVNNEGNSKTHLILAAVHNSGYVVGSPVEKHNQCDRHKNVIKFSDSIFHGNIDTNSIIYIIPINTIPANVRITINNCSFCYNYVIQLIKIDSKVQILWQMSHGLYIKNTSMSSNRHSNGLFLTSLSNSLLTYEGSVFINNNSYYKTLFTLHVSQLRLNHGYLEISNNIARNLLHSIQGSYVLLFEHALFNVTKNIVHLVLKQDKVNTENLGAVCPFQFSSKYNLDATVAKNKTLEYKILVEDYVITAAQYSTELIQASENCTWLANTAFKSSKSRTVFGHIMHINVSLSSKYGLSIIPSSICVCAASRDFNCTSHDLGTIYPGQTLTVALIVPRLKLIGNNSTTLTVCKALKHSCSVVVASEMSQSHPSYGCNQYNYTVWSLENECELCLKEDDSERFFITLKPCPAGFSLQDGKKSCYCDLVLQPYITICSVNDETIDRPANSWISAATDNTTHNHTYAVSLNCPFDFCLSKSSSLKLSAPDSQCQFNRHGVLCGQCQYGLSTVFGTSQCKQCSNVYLLIVIPIAIAGIVLVLLLFALNLTVTNGTINTFIFYVNILSINLSLLLPECHPFVCTLLSIFNLDLGIETCFYDGMTDYVKMWLQLAFPLYLIIITVMIILGSRYSTRIQRLTARRGLAVLATLFLLSYTKILSTVSRVLFFYTSIIHLPSERKELVWSVDTSIKLFSKRFIAIFVACLAIFLILLPFNAVLLFTRTLLRIKYINNFKPVIDTYCGPYKDSYYYWTGLQLVVRALVFGLSAVSNNHVSGIIILAAVLSLHGITNPFKSRYKNVQESLLLLNLLAVHVIALCNISKETANSVIIEVLVFSAIIYFILFVICHWLLSIYGNTFTRSNNWIIKFIEQKFTSKTDMQSCQQLAMEPLRISDGSEKYQEFQEPLIAVDN